VADIIKPVVHLFFPCDEAVLDLADEKWTLKNPWHTVAMPPGVTGNFVQEEIWLYAQLTAGWEPSASAYNSGTKQAGWWARATLRMSGIYPVGIKCLKRFFT